MAPEIQIWIIINHIRSKDSIPLDPISTPGGTSDNGRIGQNRSTRSPIAEKGPGSGLDESR